MCGSASTFDLSTKALGIPVINAIFVFVFCCGVKCRHSVFIE